VPNLLSATGLIRAPTKSKFNVTDVYETHTLTRVPAFQFLIYPTIKSSTTDLSHINTNIYIYFLGKSAFESERKKTVTKLAKCHDQIKNMCVTLGFCHDVEQICALLGYYAA
jgi:hypothetical protein